MSVDPPKERSRVEPGLGVDRLLLAELPMFRGIGERFHRALEERLTWIGVSSGATLFREGDPPNALYVVLYGRLAATVERPAGPFLVGQVGAGELVGEMGLITGEPRSATLTALRDSELLRLDREAFDALIESHPEALLHICRQLSARLRQASRGSPPDAAPRTVLIGAATSGAPVRPLADALARAIRDLGQSVLVVDAAAAAGRDREWLHQVEKAHDRVLYVADFADRAWTQRCLRQADSTLLAARAGEPPPENLPFGSEIVGDVARPTELVLVDEADGEPRGAGPWLERIAVDLHSHVRLTSAADVARLARLLVRRAVGIALSGGGARGIAHIGVIRALREHGVAIDLFGGTSMGAIIGGASALGWDEDQVLELVRVHLADSRPFRDFTLPFISLARGRKVTNMLRQVFGSHRVEDTRMPFFCVSTNLTVGDPKVHDSGPMWRAIRASISLPGLLPPVVEAGEVLVDGGMINNFPSDVLDAMRRGPIIGCDVARVRGLRSTVDAFDDRSLWWLLRFGRREAPSIASILMSSGTVSSAAQANQCRLHTDLLLEPPLEGYSMLDWRGYRRAAEIGYEYASALLDDPANLALLERR